MNNYTFIILLLIFSSCTSVQNVNITEINGNNLATINLTNLNETASISGAIAPAMENISILLKKFGEPEFVKYTVTEKDASYKFKGLASGTYDLYVYFDNDRTFYDYQSGLLDIGANESVSFNVSLAHLYSIFTDRIIIRFENGVSTKEKMDLIRSYNCTLTRHLGYRTLYTVVIPSDKTPNEMIAQFKKDPIVKSADRYTVLHAGGEGMHIEPIEFKSSNVTAD